MYDPTTSAGRPAKEGALVLPFVRPVTPPPPPPEGAPAAGRISRPVVLSVTLESWRQAA